MLIGIIGGGVMLLLVARLSGFGAGATDHERFHQRWFEVVEVIDGHTLRLRSDEAPPFEVKLAGVDTTGVAEAPAFVAERHGGRVLVYLEDVPTRDSAGNLLAYLFLPDDTLLNEHVLAAGLGYADRRWEYAFRGTFQQAEEAAWRQKQGLWASQDESQMPEWRQRWLAEMRKDPWKRQEWRLPDEP